MELSVPVSKKMPFKQLTSIISQFEKQKLSFGVQRIVGRDCVLWREPLSGELTYPRLQNDDRKNVIMKKRFPQIDKFDWIWIDGKMIKRAGIFV